MPKTKKFTENIFADGHKAAKFVKIFSLEKIALYGSLHDFDDVIEKYPKLNSLYPVI